MTPPVIYAVIDKVRRAAAHTEARGFITETDRALLTLADLVDEFLATVIDDCATTKPELIEKLRAAVPPRKETT